jgi:hypothetical protein
VPERVIAAGSVRTQANAMFRIVDHCRPDPLPLGASMKSNKYARQRTWAKILPGGGVASSLERRTNANRQLAKGDLQREQMLTPRPNSAKSNHDKPGPPPLQTFIHRRVGDPDQWGYLK